ncbi:MAG: carbohydrate ABC transporter permease [Clostridiales bacterium]|jgi:putative aldouronate transport system permease protein|nr:carbohydrate ABC transporter permease [Clostridiales bacterium]MDR2751806.1 carbohydrate ABC transporter permease [Clostridiales bacterium]
MAMKRRRADLPLILITSFLILWGLIVLFPFYNAVLISLVPMDVYYKTPILLYPKSATLLSYIHILNWRNLLSGFKNTLFVLLVGTTYNVILTTLTAYALTKNIPGKSVFKGIIIFTMFFGGGLLPFYLLIVNMHLVNSLWAMVLPSGVSIFNLLLMQSYYRTLPDEFEESARIDGAGELTILFRIVLPLCKPMLATITLYYAVDRWNEWYNGMLFMQKTAKWPLQLFIRNMLSDAAMILQAVPASQRVSIFSEGMKMAAIVITMTPIICVYPFLQKYFVKGITLGGVKG